MSTGFIFPMSFCTRADQQPAHSATEVPGVDQIMRSLRALHPWERKQLLDEHNVNLHSSGEGDDFLDGEDGEQFEGLTIIDEQEFFERYVD